MPNQTTPLSEGVLAYYNKLSKENLSWLRILEIDLLKLAASKDITAQKAYIISFMLGNVLYKESKPTDDIPDFTFPEFNKMRLDVTQGWYFLVSNLKVKAVVEDGQTRPASGKIAVVTVMMRSWVMDPDTGKKVIKDVPVMEGIQALDATFAVTFLIDDGLQTRVKGAAQVDSKLLNPEVAFAQDSFSVKTSTRSYQGPKWDENTSDDDPLTSLFPLTMDFSDDTNDIAFKLYCTQADEQRQALYFREGFEGLYPIKDEDRDWHYYSIAQIPTKGEVSYREKVYQVEGVSWFDHQWASLYQPLPRFHWNIAEEKFGGWAWFCFHFENGDALTFAAVHKSIPLFFGSSKFSLEGYGKYIYRDKKPPTPLLGTVDFDADYKSPSTGAKYPTSWAFNLKEAAYEEAEKTMRVVPGGFNLNMQVQSIFDDQLTVFGNLLEFWEGGAYLNGQITYEDGKQPLTLKGEGFCESVGFEPIDKVLLRMGEFFLK